MLSVDFFRRMFYVRYSVICLLALLFFGPVAVWTGARELLANTLLVQSFWQAFSLTVACLWVARQLFVQAGVTLFNAAARFRELQRNGPPPPSRALLKTSGLQITWAWSTSKTLAWLAAGLTLPAIAVWYSTSGQPRLPGAARAIDTVGGIQGLAGLVVGLIFDWGLLLAVAFAARRLVSASATIPGLLPVRIEPGFGKPGFLWMNRIAWYLASPGYTTPSSRKHGTTISFRPGHWQQLVVLAFLIAAYVLLGKLTEGSTARPGPPVLPTLFFAVMGLGFVSTVLAMASFFLDFFRFPVLLLLTGAVALSYKYPGRDHTFAAPEVDAAKVKIDPPTLFEVVQSKKGRIPDDKAGHRTLVVVTAPGGGIHAAAWTARVLTGLHYRYGDAYAQSLFMISAVSGGSLGTLYYAADFDRLQDPAEDARLRENCDAIVARAGQSGLEAIGWGWLFVDLSPASIFRNFGDRGTLLDECWRSRLRRHGEAVPETLAEWREPTRAGKLPIVVFNSTDVESGRRVLFSPVYSHRRDSLYERPNRDAGPVEFSRSFAHYDLGLATAVRLSATFPYVTPTAAPFVAPGAIPYVDAAGATQNLSQMGHMADGGYADNEGIETAVDWISKLVDHFAEADSEAPPFDRILVLRIRHEVPSDPLGDERTTPEMRTRASDGFQFAAFGPLKAVLTVRGASQVERGQVEVDLLKDVPRKIAVAGHEIAIDSKFIDFNVGGDDPPPLSWKLSPKEFARYDIAWERLKKKAETESRDETPPNVLREIDEDYFSMKRP